MTTPIDQHHRDRIRESLDESLFIEAGAGTGKTRSLIDRLIFLVDSGVELRNVAAITFTEAAAAELKDRLRQAVEANAAKHAGTPTEHRWVRAQHQLDAAAIQTLHAFAQRILAAHPLEAGLPPGFETMDGVRSELAFDERWQEFLDAFLSESGLADLVETFVALNGDFSELRRAAHAIHGNWDLLPSEMPSAGPRPSVIPTDVIAALEVFEGCVGQNTAPDRFADTIAGVPAALAAIRSSPNLVATLRVLSRIDPKKVGKAGNWPSGMLKDAKLAVEDFREARATFRASLGEWCASEMVTYLARFALEYAAERRTAGTLDFHDLLAVTRNVLRENTDVRKAVHERFTRLLIDEFQDTDPLQIEIASLIVRPLECPGHIPWHEAPVPPGSLVVVGDPKQSIYRFRRADIQLYLAAASTLTATQVELVQNWRSVPALIQWVNEVFVQLIGAEPDHVNGQPAYVGLAPGREVDSDTAHVHWFGREYPTMPTAREAEAEAIARSVLRVRDEAWALHQKDGSTAAARLSDIAILFPRRSILPFLERAFERRGIPYRVESRSLLYETQDVVDLVNILAALVDPTDQVATIAALRSPAFACSDRDLSAWSGVRGQWDYTRATPDGIEPDHPVAQAMQWLRDTSADTVRLPVNHIVERVIRERRLMELAFAYRRPRERWQRYRFVLEQSRAFAGGPGASLRGFVSWMRRQADERANVVETAVPEPDDDAVRLMTVHASKGLEFPVVVLAGLGNQPPTKSSSVIWDDTGLPMVNVGRIQSPGYADAKVTDRQREAAELQRVLYVAATRAREHLLVSLFRGERSSGSYARRLAGLLDDGLGGWHELVLDEERENQDASQHHPTLPPEDRDAWQARRVAVVAERTAGRAIAATAIARRMRTDVETPEIPGDSMDEAQPWKRGRAGTSIGRAVHAVLQTVDIETGDGLAEASRAQVVAEGVAGREAEVAALARAAIESQAVREAVQSGRYWREVFVSTPLEGHLIEGFIDVLYERDGELVVVDYKTDAVRTAADIDRAVERYRYQAAAYALALGKQLGRDVAECRFVFVREGGAEERVVRDLPAVIQEISAWLASSSAGESSAPA